jgi:AraC-like DNA-binding protein
VKKKILIKTYLVFTTLLVILVTALYSTSNDLDILPTILETKNHKKPLRTPDTFAENFSKQASKGELIYLEDSAFSFKYSKSDSQPHPFTGVFFPLENLTINFSEYDAIEIGIKTKKARRIPFNLSVQNKKDTHQYIRNFIEITDNREMYTLRLDEFFTPTSWYDRNNVAQVDIPIPDYSKIEALSFESCHLLENSTEDEFQIFCLRLKQDKDWIYWIIASFIGLSAVTLWAWFFGMNPKKNEVIHIPIKQIEYQTTDSPEDRILIFLGENYTNPNLTLNDLTKEFGINSREMSSLIKNKTEMSFPKYINFMRIEEAKRILKAKDYKTVSEVGYAVGFNSPSNFNRVFKTVVGVSPKQFE